MSKGTYVQTKHLPKFQALMQLHQNVVGGKVDGHGLAPFAALPDKAFRFNEMMQCNGKLQAYYQSRKGADQFQYGFCLANKVCPDEMDEWTSCFQHCQKTGESLDACAVKKRLAENCSMKFSQDCLRLFVDYELFPK
jgi:hypothetical protein